MTLRIDAMHLAVAAALTLRFSVLAAVLPFMGHRSVPLLWRLALAVTVALAVAPVVIENMQPANLPAGWAGWVAEALHSLTAGALLTFAVGIPFAAVRYAGQVTGLQIGFAIVNTIDPQSNAQVSVLGQFYYLLAVLLFFAVNAHHTVVLALVRSCAELPLFTAWDGTAGSWLVVQQFGAIFRLGLQIAAPCIIVLLLVSAAMGVIVKTVPHINVLVVGFPVRIAAGLATLGLSLVFFREVFLSLMRGLDGQLGNLLASLQ